jgi:hypothetical protein
MKPCGSNACNGGSEKPAGRRRDVTAEKAAFPLVRERPFLSFLGD